MSSIIITVRVRMCTARVTVQLHVQYSSSSTTVVLVLLYPGRYCTTGVLYFFPHLTIECNSWEIEVTLSWVLSVSRRVRVYTVVLLYTMKKLHSSRVYTYFNLCMYVCMYDVCEGQPMLICTLYNSCTVLYSSTIHYSTTVLYCTVLNTVYSKY